MSTATRPTQTLTTSKGRSIDTPYTEAEAYAACVKLTTDTFAQKLVADYRKYGSLRGDKLVWLHILAVEGSRPLPSVQPAGLPSFAPIQTLFATATQNGLKKPSIKLQTVSGTTVDLSLAGPRSRYPGAIHVTDGGPYGNNNYYGRIEVDGSLAGNLVSLPSLTAVVLLLMELAADPAGVAAKYGKLTGHCCFCNASLTDARSTVDGYGPICAKRYGLPWGNTVPPIAAAVTPPTPPAPPAAAPILGYVNVYLQQKVRGGSEEGGWYYDTAKLVYSLPFDTLIARDQLLANEQATADSSNAGKPEYDDPSCPALYGVWVEDQPGRSFPVEPPPYA